MSEPTQLCDVLTVELIASYLGVVPGKVRVMLHNASDGGYVIQIADNQWVRVVSVPVEKVGGVAWTPRYPAPAAPAKVAQ